MKKQPLTVPDLPEPTGRTRRLVARLVQRRKDLGWSQQDLADVIVAYSKKVADHFGEEPKWPTLSRQSVNKWESMFNPAANEKLKNFPMSTYGIWARALGMRMYVDFSGTDEELVQIAAGKATAPSLRRLAALPARQQQTISTLIDDLWKAYESDEEGEGKLRNW